jgi:hypothetical protein
MILKYIRASISSSSPTITLRELLLPHTLLRGPYHEYHLLEFSYIAKDSRSYHSYDCQNMPIRKHCRRGSSRNITVSGLKEDAPNPIPARALLSNDSDTRAVGSLPATTAVLSLQPSAFLMVVDRPIKGERES